MNTLVLRRLTACALLTGGLYACGGSDGASANTGDGSPGKVGGSGGETFLNLNTQSIVLHTTNSSKGLVITATHIQQEVTPVFNYLEWFGEVRNGTPSIQCYVDLKADFRNSAGATVITLSTYADGAPYKLPNSSSAAPCLAPGASASLYTNELPVEAIDLRAIKLLDVSLSSTVADTAVPHPLTPVIADLQYVPSTSTLRGTATGVGGPIHDLHVEFLQTKGDFYDWGYARDEQPLLADATWDFSYSGLEIGSASVADLLVTIGFSEGQARADRLTFGNGDAQSSISDAATGLSNRRTQIEARRAIWQRR